MTPYYEADGIRLYQGDCLDVLSALNETFDIAVTSPPYNMGLTPGGNGRDMYRPGASRKGGRFRDGYSGDANTDDLDWADYDQWQRDVIRLLLTTARRAVYYNHRSRVIHGRLRLPLDGRWDDLPLRQLIVWDRGTGIDVNLRHYCTAHELVLLFAHDDFKLVDHSASGVSDVWRLGMNRDQAAADHPAPFPVGLPARAIATSGATSIVDPFVGSGSSMVAAQAAGIPGVGIDKSAKYLDMAVRRLAQRSLFA